MTIPTSTLLHRITERFRRIYGDETGRRCGERFERMVGRYGVGVEDRGAAERWSERDAFVITYGDMVRSKDETPLATLNRFALDYLAGAINTVHILPFFPYSSDDGFSVIDYRVVDPELGTWDDVQQLGKRFRLMFDLVLNHCSSQSAWFKQYTAGVSPGREFFLEVDPDTDLSAVVRPRPWPLLTETHTRNGVRHVWTTFSEDQVDLNFANPDVLFEFLDILFFYISQGACVIRLDAIAYMWKEIGTPCIHHPKTHEIVKVMRDILDLVAPHVVLLTETNVPHQENISYMGDGDEAHMVYQFSLPPLLLHALQTGRADVLTTWAAGLGDLPEGCTYFNFTASHDGIGVRPLEGILPPEELDAILERIAQRGGKVSTKRNSDGSESAYELNITYLDALCDPEDDDPELGVRRFLCSQTIAMALQGVPAAYFHSLVGTRNHDEGMAETGRARTINRRKWNDAQLRQQLDDPTTEQARICTEYVRRLRIRTKQPAFHPDAAQHVVDLGPELFAFERRTDDGSQCIAVLNNVNHTPQTADLNAFPHLPPQEKPVDLLSGKPVPYDGTQVTVPPYGTLWLT